MTGSSHFALTLPKGYAKEYKDRNYFNSIYFSKLSMYHEQEGYIPILYQFDIEQDSSTDYQLPNSLLMTFYYPESRRMSNLNGLVIVGGQPSIYQAYQMTRSLTPYLESLTLEEHGIGHDATRAVIEETLNQLANPISVRSTQEVIERSQGKSGEDLSTFFPILGDDNYQREQLALPMDFAIDAIFIFKITDEFFQTTQIGSGIESMQLFGSEQMMTKPSLAFPLIFKWQPIYNDILNSLKKAQGAIPHDYSGKLIPSIIIFDRQGSDQKTALISAVQRNENDLYLHIAVANSGAEDGQPLSLLQKALAREKFGQQRWMEKLENNKIIPEDSIRDQEYGEDLIASQLTLKLPETQLTTDGVFDLGKLRSLQVETEDMSNA